MLTTTIESFPGRGVYKACALGTKMAAFFKSITEKWLPFNIILMSDTNNNSHFYRYISPK
jgi:hypothetical protein